MISAEHHSHRETIGRLFLISAMEYIGIVLFVL